MSPIDGYDPPQPLNQYRPNGNFGPVCDSLVPQYALSNAVLDGAGQQRCTVDSDCPAGYICVDGFCVPDDRVRVWPASDDWPEPVAKVNCKERIAEDGTIEYYDCQVDMSSYFDDIFNEGAYDSTCIPVDGQCYNWNRDSNIDLEFDGDLTAPNASPYVCRPFDPDINIRPVEFIRPDGTTVTKYAISGSLPTTFPVTGPASGGAPTSPVLTVKFSDNGRKLIVEGSGVGIATFDFEWDDDPNTQGVAVSTITIATNDDTITFTQSGTSGSQSKSIDIKAGTYDITYTGLNSANNPIDVQNNNKKICLYDGGGTDCNASLTIAIVDSETAYGDNSVWSAEANRYAVWVNQAECTLPCEEQTVTYTIDFDTSDIYYFEFGADDSGELYFDDESLPFLTATTPNMLSYSFSQEAIGPAKTSKSISAGSHQITVSCTNGVIDAVPSQETYYFGNTDWYTNFSKSNAVYIRTQNQPGWTSTGGSGLDEVSGLSVPSDSNTGKYLSFGVVDEEGANQTLVTQRTCQFDMDLSNATKITFHVRAGNDENGAELPNNISESLRFSFDQTNWTKLGVTRQYSGLNRAQYQSTYGDWYEYSVTIPSQYRTSSTTLYFEQDIDGGPEYANGYNGLSDSAFTAAYQNGGDVFGIYKLVVDGVQPNTYSCSNISDDSYIWNKNPGGWYIKICKYAPCAAEQRLGWVRCSSPFFDSLLQQYAVWTSSTDPGPLDTWQELDYNITVIRDDTLTLQASGDNRIQITFNGTQYINLATLNQIDTVTIPNVTAGSYILNMRVMNDTSANGDNGWSGNPAGGAWKLTYSNGDIVRTSADLSQANSSNLYWNTRKAAGYLYTTVVQNNEAQP